MNQVFHQFKQDPGTEEGQIKSILAALSRQPRLFGIIFTFFFLPVAVTFLAWPTHYQTKGMVIVGNLDFLAALWLPELKSLATLQTLKAKYLSQNLLG